MHVIPPQAADLSFTQHRQGRTRKHRNAHTQIWGEKNRGENISHFRQMLIISCVCFLCMLIKLICSGTLSKCLINITMYNFQCLNDI